MDNKPEFYYNNQLEVMKKRLPQFSIFDAKEAEAQVATYGRLVDFKESFIYKENILIQYIYYMRNFQNLFDLEFFSSKLPSTTYSIAGLEQCALSGASFWEDADDGAISSDEYLDNQSINKPMYSDQSDEVDSPYRNKVANKIIKKVEIEKKGKR